MATADLPRQPLAVHPPTHSPGNDLERNLELLAKKRTRQQLLRSLARAAIVGLGIASLMVLAYRFYLIDGAWWEPALAIAIALAIGLRNGLINRTGAFEAAVDADRAGSLQDRLSSAYAFVRPDAVRRRQSAPASRDWRARIRATLVSAPIYRSSARVAPTSLVPALVIDAAVRSRGLDAKSIYSTKADRKLAMVLGCVALLFTIFCFMPNIQWFRSMEQRRLAAVLAKQGDQLVSIAKVVREHENDQSLDSEAKKLAKKLHDLGLKLQHGRMSKKEALVSMGQLKEDLQRAVQNDQQRESPDMANLAKALQNQQMESPDGQQLQQDLDKGDYEKAAQTLEKIADKMDKGQLKPEDAAKAASDLQKAADAMRQAGGAKNEAAARQLQSAADALRQQSKQGAGQNKGQQNQGQNGQGQSQQGSSQQKSGQQGSGGGSGLRRLAKGLRQGGSQMNNGQDLQKMLDKIQQAESDTGQNGGEQGSGSDTGKNSGDGQQGGEGEGKTLTPGKDLVPTTQGPMGGAGLGPRSGNQPHSSGGGVSKDKATHTGDKRRWEDQWSDKLPPTHSKIDRITGKIGSQGETEQLPTRTESQGGQVNTPYYQAYSAAKKDAEDAVSKDQIPPAYKQPVKDYFGSIKPGQ